MSPGPPITPPRPFPPPGLDPDKGTVRKIVCPRATHPDHDDDCPMCHGERQVGVYRVPASLRPGRDYRPPRPGRRQP